MIKRFFLSLRPKRHSLYLGLIGIIIVGTLFAILVYTGGRKLSEFVINKYYITEENRHDREENYLKSLQRYCNAKNLSSDDIDEIAKWSKENRYVYLLVYKDDQIFFSSEIESDKENGSDYPFIGDMGSSPTREELLATAEKNGYHELVLSDGSLVASIAEFTEYLYYDLTNVGSLVVAIMILAAFLIFYVSTIIARIKKLETDVAIVSGGRMTHKISGEGKDEIATLSENVEIMRNSILDKLRMEREARDANTELITSISHDIRTPLTVLLGYIDMMKNHEGCDDVMKEYITASENTAMRLKHLSDDMFKYSLAFGESDKGIKLEEYDAATLIEQLLSEHILLIRENGFEFIINESNQSIAGTMVYTDAPNLMRIIDNIFSNFAKYADSDEPIEMTMTHQGESMILQFKNKIRKNPGEAESNGIGLKTCTRLATFIAEEFKYSEENGYFITQLALKLRQEGKK